MMTPEEAGAKLLLGHPKSPVVQAFVAGYTYRDGQFSDAIYEDELPEGYPYDEMFPFSWVDIVRMFPSMEFVRGYLACISRHTGKNAKPTA